MTVITRFAPSPTGFLHIGGARTALFNWLYARHHGGQFLLRIEDTDQERSTLAATEAIFRGLEWLGLDWDEDVVFQSRRFDRHLEAARDLVAKGHAYYCTCSKEELEAMREHARAGGQPPRYDGRCRNQHHTSGVIRLKMPQDGTSVLEDLVQGRVEMQNTQLDDLILVRADHTPTYMLSVVVDDHDMKITHIIRGDDHLTNAFKQMHLYQSLGYDVPKMAHIPLIHGPDGAKLSKRHGALGVEAYQDMGYLPEAMCNYLLRLGWSHGDEEIISRAQAVEWFDLDHVGKSPSRFDFKKLENLNGHYIRESDDGDLVELIRKPLEQLIDKALNQDDLDILKHGMKGLKERAKTLVELTENAAFYVRDLPLPMQDAAAALLTSDARALIGEVVQHLKNVSSWTESSLEESLRDFAAGKGLGLGKLAQPLRIVLTGATISPSVFEIMTVLGKEKSLNRLMDS